MLGRCTVFVVADSYWIAKRAADALEIELDAGPAAGLHSKNTLDDRNAALDSDKAVVHPSWVTRSKCSFTRVS